MKDSISLRDTIQLQEYLSSKEYAHSVAIRIVLDFLAVQMYSLSLIPPNHSTGNFF